jgi:hypothetical protein
MARREGFPPGRRRIRKLAGLPGQKPSGAGVPPAGGRDARPTARSATGGLRVGGARGAKARRFLRSPRTSFAAIPACLRRSEASASRRQAKAGIHAGCSMRSAQGASESVPDRTHGRRNGPRPSPGRTGNGGKVLRRIVLPESQLLAVIASGAKQSRSPSRRPLDCFAPLAMTAFVSRSTNPCLVVRPDFRLSYSAMLRILADRHQL